MWRATEPAVRRVWFRVLGPIEVVRDDGAAVTVSAARDRTLLAALLAHRNKVVGIPRLGEWVWGDPDVAPNTVQARVSSLRRLLGDPGRDHLEFQSGGYRLRVGAGEADDEQLARTVAEARALLSSDAGAAARLVEEALRGHRGEPYGGLRDPWLEPAVVRLEELVTAAREVQARALLVAGELPEACALARGLVQEYPLRPGARVVLVRALDQLGRRAEALETLTAGRVQFARAAGLDLPQELAAEQATILRAERAVVRARREPLVLQPADMVRWLANDGAIDSALRLAVRCAWGWWLAADRRETRGVIDDLLRLTPPSATADRRMRLRAQVWSGVLGIHGHDERETLDRAEKCLLTLTDGWDATDVLAALLIADRRNERGEQVAAQALLAPVLAYVRRSHDPGMQAMAEVTQARVDALTGHNDRGEARSRAALATFESLDDPAGELAALNVLGYAAETRGHYAAAIGYHSRALGHAVHGGWDHAQCWQLIRLGNLHGLTGEAADAKRRHTEALRLAEDLHSPGLLAFARLGIGLSALRVGARTPARQHLATGLGWYRSAGSRTGVALASAALARVSDTRRGVRTLMEESLRAAAESADPRGVAYALETVAILSARPAAAARTAGAAAALRARVGRPLPAGEQPDLEARLAAARDSLGRTYDTHRSAGTDLGSTGEPVQVARRLLATSFAEPRGSR